MRTLEGELKEQIKLYLKQLGASYYMPVPSGYGRQSVDFLVCCPQWFNHGRIGRYLAIETKAPGKKPTPRQAQFLAEIKAAGGVAFWCDSYEGFLLEMAANGLTPMPTGGDYDYYGGLKMAPNEPPRK